MPKQTCWAKKDVKKNSNAYDKNRTQDNIKYQIQHEESWLEWIVIEQINYKQHYFWFILERICAGTLSKPLRKK